MRREEKGEEMSETIRALGMLSLCGISIVQSIWLGRLSRRLQDHERQCHFIRTESCEICGGRGRPSSGKQSNVKSFSQPRIPDSSLTETTDGSSVVKMNDESLGRSL